MKLLNGSDLAGFIKERQAKQVRALRQASGIFPRLAIVASVTSPVIDVYMGLKKRYGEDILIDVEIHRTNSDEIISVIEGLNNRDDIQGIIVQLPLDNMLEVERVLSSVDPAKDVDGLNPDSTFDAATPMAINWLLAGYGIDLGGKKIALVGRGRLVGAPLEKMWLNSGLKVDTFEKGDRLDRLSQYDVVISATGSPGVIEPSMVKTGAVIVDAGTAVEDGEIRGDVSAEVRLRDDIAITPEKGGVGPLTVAALFDNVITACLRIANNSQQ
ncbi:hypothetical protein B7Y94_04785 [Candidatus Saccharibacteria bacterium 32-49-12]|nr:MAG: hypothetical protein B7Y94_04785 [Candidatus Saccharibacteria bacterium 32-49-12]